MTHAEFNQIASSAADRELWGRCVRGYEGAFGTGCHIDDAGVDGRLSFYMPVAEWELRDTWRASKFNIEDPQSFWHSISDYPILHLNMMGYKSRRGFFKAAWLGPLRFFFAKNEPGLDRQVDVGYLAATDILGLFALFDKWRAGKHQPSFDMDETLRRAV